LRKRSVRVITTDDIWRASAQPAATATPE
jgi:hypothetical protein